ncbi:MAG: hypothetical protein MPN21_01110 [Thermoanaerobaculia bacterium]|nr:hypothetical protein [Thermoanaerobaculia bacterium]
MSVEEPREAHPASGPERTARSRGSARLLSGGRERAAPTSSRGTWLAAVFVVLVFGSIAAYFTRDVWSRAGDLQVVGLEEAALGAVDTVGVLPVENAARDADDWVRWGLSTAVSETLHRTPGLEVVEPERLARILGERGLGSGADRARLRELTAALGADLIIDLTFRRDQLGVRLDSELAAADGSILATRRYEAETAVEAAESLIQDVVGIMVPGFEGVPIRRALSGDPFHDRLYATGVQVLFTGFEVRPEVLDVPEGTRVIRAEPAAEIVRDPELEALQRAQGYFAQAVRDRPGFLQAHLRWIDGLRRQRKLSEARRATQDLLQTAQAEGAFELLERLYRELGRLEALDGNLDAAEVQLREAHRLSLARGDDGSRTATLREMARLELASNNPSRAEELLVEVLGLTEERGDRLGRIDVLIHLGSLLMAEDDVDGARSLLDRALILAEDLRDPWTENRAAASLGEVASRQGKGAQALEFWDRALRFYRSRGEDSRVLLLSRRLAETHLARMDWKASEQHFHDVLELAQTQDDPRLIARASVHLAWLQLKLGFPFQAEEHLQRALAHDRFLENRDRLQRVIAWFAYEQGNRRLALETQEEILRQCQGKGCWNRADQAFLDVFRLAYAEDQRLPLPGEVGGPDFPGW